MANAAMSRVDGTFELRDGTTVTVRPIRPEDAADLIRFHHSLSQETTYLRFFSVHPELSQRELHHFTHVDHQDRDAIVAVIDGHIVGVARYDRLPTLDEAEVAFVIADRWQGHGLCRILFQQLITRARAVGIRRLVADVLPHNSRMLAVLHGAALPATSRFQDGVVRVTVELADG